MSSPSYSQTPHTHLQTGELDEKLDSSSSAVTLGPLHKLQLVLLSCLQPTRSLRHIFGRPTNISLSFCN